VIAALALALSFLANRGKTVTAMRISAKKFVNILPAFLTMLVLVSIALSLVPDRTISLWLGSESKFSGTVLASLIGSVTLMPGFIAFPLCGILLRKGVPYMVLSAFTTTLMMVGVLTYPLEKAYWGKGDGDKEHNQFLHSHHRGLDDRPLLRRAVLMGKRRLVKIAAILTYVIYHIAA